MTNERIAEFRSGGVTVCTGRSPSMAAASNRTTAARRCSSTSTRYAASDGDTSLVLMGVKMMKVPDEPYLRQAGVLPDRERMIAYEAADVTIAPGPGRSACAVGPRKLRRRHAGPRQRAQRCGRRTLPPRRRRPVLREQRRVRRGAASADDAQQSCANSWARADASTSGSTTGGTRCWGGSSDSSGRSRLSPTAAA